MKKYIPKIITVLVIVAIIFATKFLYCRYLMPYNVIHKVENATIISKYTTFPKHRVYYIEIKTTNGKTFSKNVDTENNYDKYHVGEDIKVEYNENYFRFEGGNSVSDIYVIK